MVPASVPAPLPQQSRLDAGHRAYPDMLPEGPSRPGPGGHFLDTSPPRERRRSTSAGRPAFVLTLGWPATGGAS